MVKERNPAWEAHTSHFAPSTTRAKCYDWVCKYCGKNSSSGLTRLEEHIAKVGGNIAPCPDVSIEIANEVFKKIQSNPRRKRNFVEVGETMSSNPQPSSSPSASASASAHVSDHARRPVQVRQTSLSEASGGGSIKLKSHIQKLQEEAEGEIARTIIECNLSFNVLKVNQWKKMVVAIAKAGYQEGWTGLSYNDMRGKRLVEEKNRIDRLLDPVRAGWVKYGCSILSDGWSDRKKRGLINILVSSPLGTYFLRAVDSAKGGQKTTADFLYKHIRQAIHEVKIYPKAMAHHPCGMNDDMS